eukprot:3600548-Alexandrium_andersonii.AAC.1
MDGTAPLAPVELAKQCLEELIRSESVEAAAALATWLLRAVSERGRNGFTFHQWSLTVWVWILGVARVDQ